MAPFELEAKLRSRLTLIDTPGVVGLALAAVDMGSWDVLAQAVNLAALFKHEVRFANWTDCTNE